MATVTIYYGSNSQAHSEMFSSGGLSKTDSEGNLLCYYTTITQEMLSAYLPQKEGFSFSGFKVENLTFGDYSNPTEILKVGDQIFGDPIYGRATFFLIPQYEEKCLVDIDISLLRNTADILRSNINSSELFSAESLLEKLNKYLNNYKYRFTTGSFSASTSEVSLSQKSYPQALFIISRNSLSPGGLPSSLPIGKVTEGDSYYVATLALNKGEASYSFYNFMVTSARLKYYMSANSGGTGATSFFSKASYSSTKSLTIQQGSFRLNTNQFKGSYFYVAIFKSNSDVLK